MVSMFSVGLYPLQIVTAWNGQAMSAFALAARTLPAEHPPPKPCFPVDACTPDTYMAAAVKVAEFARHNLWDERTGRLRRAFCKAPSAVEGAGWGFGLTAIDGVGKGA